MNRPPFAARLTLLLVSSLTVMSGATIAPALPPLAEHFASRGVADAAFWSRMVLTAPAIGIVLTATAAGALGDRFGRVPLMLAAAVLYAVAGSAGLWIDDMAPLVASRVALGIAVAVLMTGATALIGDTFHGPARDSFMGVQASFMGYGGVVFLSVGGALADVHWRAPFGLYLTGLGVLGLIALTLRGPATAAARSHERLTDNPPPRGPAVPPVVLYGLAALTFATFYQTPTLMPFRLESMGLSDRTMGGMIIATLPLVAATSALVFGRLRTRLSLPLILALSYGLFGAGYLGVAHTTTPAAAWAGLALSGIGLGWAMPTVSIWLLSIVPAERRGRAIGGLTAGVFIGQFIAPLASRPVVAVLGAPGAFGVAAGVLGVAALGMMILHRTLEMAATTQE
ncbi:MAG: MFS transporter [Rhodospirillaceae bacterium]